MVNHPINLRNFWWFRSRAGSRKWLEVMGAARDIFQLGVTLKINRGPPWTPWFHPLLIIYSNNCQITLGYVHFKKPPVETGGRHHLSWAQLRGRCLGPWGSISGCGAAASVAGCVVHHGEPVLDGRGPVWSTWGRSCGGAGPRTKHR